MSRKRDAQIADMVGKPISEKMNQLEDAVRRDGEKTRAEYTRQIGEIKEITDAMLEDLSSREKKELYDLNTTVDISELNDTEKEFLVAVLYTLAGMTEEVTDAQQGYLRSVKRYLDVKNVQTMVDLSKIENIDSKREEKAILRCVMEFLFLENCNHDYWDEYEDVLDYFSVRNSEIRKMEAAINNIYRATGAEGLAEKFGYIPVEPENPVTESKVNGGSDRFNHSIPGHIADKIRMNAFVQSEQYLVWYTHNLFSLCEEENGTIYHLWNKQTEEERIFRIPNYDGKPECMHIHGSQLILGFPWGCLSSGILSFDLLDNSCKILFSNITLNCDGRFSAYAEKLLFVDRDDNLTLCDLESNKHKVIATEVYRVVIDQVLTVGKHNAYYEYSGELFRYDIENDTTIQIEVDNRPSFERLIYFNNSVYAMYRIDDTLKVVEILDDNADVEYTECISINRVKAFDANEWIQTPPYIAVVTEEYGFPLYVFNTVTKELSKAASGCGYTDTDKAMLFKKAKTYYHTNEFQIVGNYLYYIRGNVWSTGELCCVDLLDANKAVKICSKET